MCVRSTFRVLLLLLVCVILSHYPPVWTCAANQDGELMPLVGIDPRRVVLTMSDGSKINVRLAEEPVVIETPHGKLSIPADDVRQIVFALRLTKEEENQITQWINALAAPDQTVRQKAAAELFALQGKAWQQLEQAEKEAEQAIAQQAAALLDKLWDAFPSSELIGRDADVVETPEAKIVGRIAVETLKIHTTQFGELELKLVDARTLRSLALPEPDAEENDDLSGARNDPGNLKSLESQVGQTYLFRVTGATNGTLYGSNPYTTDSLLAAAVVHVGFLKPGETGIVRVKMMGNLAMYAGATRNGLASSNYSGYPGYEISKAKKSRPRN